MYIWVNLKALHSVTHCEPLPLSINRHPNLFLMISHMVQELFEQGFSESSECLNSFQEWRTPYRFYSRTKTIHAMGIKFIKHLVKNLLVIFSSFNEMMAGQLSWLEHHPRTPRLQVRSPVRAPCKNVYGTREDLSC